MVDGQCGGQRRAGDVAVAGGIGRRVGVPAVAGGVLAWSAAAARTGVVSHREARLFAAVNGRSDRWAPAVHLVMSAGHFSAVPVAAGLAVGAGRPRLAARLLVAGTGSWLGCRAGKALVGRGRPDVVVADVVDVAVRGRVWTGAGYPSGHAAVATSLAVVAVDELGPMAGAVAVGVAAAVAVSRCFVGAHLPHDVIGGVALAVLVARATEVLVTT